MEHPHGVQPTSLMELHGGDDRVRQRGLGLLAPLPDECLMAVLQLLPASALGALSCVSQALYAFANHDELYKGLVLEQLEPGSWRYRSSWQDTYLTATVAGYRPGSRAPRRVHGLYSDLLYQPFLCATVEPDPSWLEVDNIERRSGLTPEQFREQYEQPNRPVILTDLVTSWPAMRRWSREYLSAAFEGKQVIVGDQPMPFDAWCEYSDATRDELPLYLFDKTFAATAPQLAADYTPPPLFGEDLFGVLGEGPRPDYRWLIMGPPKSGSSFHKDPNSTSAWNGVVSGAKKWVMYPPHVTPPGVRPSADGADVAAPVSLMEWFLNFYGHRAAAGVAPAECTLRAGELLFVPRGWWHTAMNLEETVALTQNFVSSVTLPHVLAFLSSRSEALVSGCAPGQRSGLHDRFVAALEAERPEALAAARAVLEERGRQAEERGKLASLFQQPPPPPQTGSQQPAAETPAKFAFGFKLSPAAAGPTL